MLITLLKLGSNIDTMGLQVNITKLLIRGDVERVFSDIDYIITNYSHLSADSTNKQMAAYFRRISK